ncbi:MAG: kanamycin dioxygenase [Micromonosporaceae bacterium]
MLRYPEAESEQLVRIEADVEGQTGGERAARIERATEALLADGVVIITQAVDPAFLERLAARMATDLEQLLRRPERAENFAAGHLQQDPPPEPDLLLPDVLANPVALEVCRRAMRQPVRLSRYTNNTNMPGSEPQALHLDEGQLWPGLSEAPLPARLLVNIPLSTTVADYGPTEVWPGTHLDTRVGQFSATPAEGTARALSYVLAARRANVHLRVNRRVGLTVPDEMAEERRTGRPPLGAETQLGDLIIRDPRVWHRGTANRSGHSRFMLALTYDPMWRRPEAPLTLPSAARPIFDRAELVTSAEFVDGPIGYLDRHLPPPSSPLRRATAPATGDD